MANDSLVTLPSNLTDPRNAKFTAKSPAVGSGEQGANSLVTQSMAERCAGDVTGSDFSPSKNSNETGKSLSQAVSVDFGTGTHSSPDQK